MWMQLIYALESDSAGLGKAYYAIREMKELVAGALENAGLAAHADEIQVTFLHIPAKPANVVQPGLQRECRLACL